MIAAIDYSTIANNLVLLFIALLTAWQAYKAKQRDKLAEATHTLVNSQMGVQKKMLAEVTAAKAAITKNKVDKAVADKAFKDWQEHEARQAAVDAGQKTTPA